MAYMTARQIRHQMNLDQLRELGCKVKSIQGIMFFVKYESKQLKISYLYHITKNNKYFLERIKPYVVVAGEFGTEEDVVKAISIDLEQFQNAAQSSHFDEFIAIDTAISDTVARFEDLFLYYNLEQENIDLLHQEIKRINDLLIEIKNRSERIFYKKDPNNL